MTVSVGGRGRASIAALAFFGVLLSVATPGRVSAQRLGGQRFAPAGSEDGIFGTEGAERRTPLFPYVGLWLSYAVDPVVLVDADGNELGEVVEHLFAADLVASINVWEGLEFGLAMPVTFQLGDDLAADQAMLPRPEVAALGDLTLRVAYRFRLSYTTSLAIHVPVLVPTSDPGNVLALGFGVRPTIAFVHGFGPIDLVANVSFLVREEQRAVDYDGGHELGARLGLRIGLDREWYTALLVEGGMSTAVTDFFAPAVTPAEARGGLEHWFDDHWRLSGFAGAGIGPGVGAPDFRAGVGLSFGDKPRRPRIEPRPGDEDADGVLDDADECPLDPEDRDGFEDDDGCPDEDNDRDGVADIVDECPNEPETLNGLSDDDGCPDQIRIEGSQITTFHPVRFRSDSDEIMPESHDMLREVANVMKANPDMAIRVEGHTDSEGDDDYNMTLSQRRADSVMRFIAGEGIDESRLEAVGRGETRPLASNATPQGRRRNRRVEFHIGGR
jgi:outer membrane protein OmpA-like peptidoglycan-associated protein